MGEKGVRNRSEKACAEFPVCDPAADPFGGSAVFDFLSADVVCAVTRFVPAVKVCGITTLSDARLSVACGARALGFVFDPRSKRCVGVAEARRIIESLPPFVACVGVFVDEQQARVRAVAEAAGLTWLQFHGQEGVEFCGSFSLPVVRAFRVDESFDFSSAERFAVAAHLFDNRAAGSGEAFDWSLLQALPRTRPWILAGGLSAHNVSAALERLRPDALDVSSGVCRTGDPRRKDPEKLEQFFACLNKSARA